MIARCCRGFLLTAACLLLAVPAGRARQDRIGWMAEQLISGKNVRNFDLAVRKFVSYSDPRVLPTLLRMTGLELTPARAAAAGVLWQYNTKEVRARLVELTKDTESVVRVEAAKSLCLMGFTASLSVLAEALATPDVEVRTRVLQALARIKNDKARKLIEGMLESKTPSDRTWASFALYQHGVEREKHLATLGKVLLDLPRMARPPDPADPDREEIGRLADRAEKGMALRAEASHALSRIGDTASLRLLVRATADPALAGHPHGPQRELRRHGDEAAVEVARGLDDDDVLIRLGCAQTARHLRVRDQAVADALASALGRRLEDSSHMVRLAALRAIAERGYDSQTVAVLKVLDHDDPQTRRRAARALGLLGGDEIAPALIERLKSETNRWVRRGIYKAIAALRSPAAVDPMFAHLKLLYRESRQNARVKDEIPLCIQALAAGGAAAADKALDLMPRLEGERRRLMVEVLARSGSERAIDFFMDQLRETPPDPLGPQVRFFDSLDRSFAPRLEEMIESETAMWIRVILARALFRMGESEYARGITWGLTNEDPYMRKLSAALSAGLEVPGSTQPLIRLLTDTPTTARLAARALLSANTPQAVAGLLEGLKGDSLRQRTSLPLIPFWEGERSAAHPYSKEVDNDRVWVVFADDRLGRKMDLFLTWSKDGKVWREPAFTGLTSFSDPEGHVPPPTFSLKVRGRDITIALTRTFAQSANFANPLFKTLQRIHRFKLRDLFEDGDGDGLSVFDERALFTHPARGDSDGDGIPDGKDKNPLAAPPDFDREEDLLKVLAFSYAYLTRNILPGKNRLLVVASPPRERPAPELATFSHLVLHLKPDQIRSMWKETGGGFPQVRFLPTEIFEDGNRAIQAFELTKGINDEERVEVTFRKRGGQWTVAEYHD